MALTPDTPNESFLREVDENLRRDQLQGFAKRYGKWLIGAVVLVLAAAAGYLYWQDRQQARAAAQSEELMLIFDQIGAGNLDQARRRLQPLEKSDNDVVRSLALLTGSALALDTNDRSAAIAKYKAVAEDKGLPEPYRNVALVRATSLEFDTLRPEEVISRLEPLAKPGNPWFGSAGEMTALAYLKQGQRERAGRLFAAIAADRQVPETIRNRAVQIAGTLGVDASAPVPQTAQSGSNE